MSDTSAARRDLDQAGAAPPPDPAPAPPPDPGDPSPAAAPGPWWPADGPGTDPLDEAARLLAIARTTLDAGPDLPPEARFALAKRSLLRLLHPMTAAQHRVDSHTLGSLEVVVQATRTTRDRTDRMLAGMATVDMAVDVVDDQVRALADEVASLRRELADLRDALARNGIDLLPPGPGGATDRP